MWQPIKTAPRDGSWFMVCRVGEPDSIEVGRYHPLTSAKFVEVGDGLYRKEVENLYDWEGFNNSTGRRIGRQHRNFRFRNEGPAFSRWNDPRTKCHAFVV